MSKGKYTVERKQDQVVIYQIVSICNKSEKYSQRETCSYCYIKQSISVKMGNYDN